MIHVERGSPPAGFAQKAAALAQQWRSARAQDTGLTASQFWQRVRPQLRAEAAELATRFHHKCAFCEARMEHLQPGHIEHYRPKGRAEFEAHMFDWSNWLLSCGRCNDSKWKHFPDCSGKPCLLDPTVDEPSQHIAFQRQEVHALTERGRETIRLLHLDRPPLSRERASWLVKVQGLLLLAACANRGQIRIEARRLLTWCLQEDAPFSAMTRAFVQVTAPKLAKPTQPHPRVSESEAHTRIARLILEHENAIKQLV